MNPTLRGILGVIAGFVAACVIMMIVESINGSVLYPELAKQAQGVTDREQIRQIFASAPVGSLLVVLVGWIVGAVVGAFIAAKIGKAPRYALTVGVLVMLGAIANNLMLPPPIWFWIAGVLVPIPAAMTGGRLAMNAAT